MLIHHHIIHHDYDKKDDDDGDDNQGWGLHFWSWVGTPSSQCWAITTLTMTAQWQQGLMMMVMVMVMVFWVGTLAIWMHRTASTLTPWTMRLSRLDFGQKYFWQIPGSPIYMCTTLWQDCAVGPCPTCSYPGLWEQPMLDLEGAICHNIDFLQSWNINIAIAHPSQKPLA